MNVPGRSSRLAVLAARFKQPSSWAGIGLLVTALKPDVPFELLVQAGTAVCALLAFLLQEPSNGK